MFQHQRHRQEDCQRREGSKFSSARLLQRSFWKLVANVSSQPFLDGASFKCLKNIYILSKKKQFKKSFQSFVLKRINSSFCLLNCFKGTACTDAIMSKVWGESLCVIEWLFGGLSERWGRGCIYIRRERCCSLLILPRQLTSSPPQVRFSSWILPFISRLSWNFLQCQLP